MRFWRTNKTESLNKVLARHPDPVAIEIRDISLTQALPSVNCSIPYGSWVLLEGADDLAKAMFCDLVFGYLSPERGFISPPDLASQVSILGRNQNTYGSSLLDHLSFGIQGVSKEQLAKVANSVFSNSFLRHVDEASPLMLKSRQTVGDAKFNEKDFLEVSEVNTLLQNKPMVIIDTTSVFYQNALDLGFKHSNLLLQSGKTIFWLIDNLYAFDQGQMPWLENADIQKISFQFNDQRLALQ